MGNLTGDLGSGLRSRDVRGWIYHDVGNPDELAASESYLSRIMTPVMPAENGEIKVAAMGAHPPFAEMRLPRKTIDAITLGQKVVCKEYDVGLRVREKHMRQEFQGLLRSWINVGISRPVQRRWVRVFTTTLEKCHTTLLAPDGQLFFDTDHKFGRNQTNQSNYLTKVIGAGTIPTQAQVEDMVWEAVTAMTTLRDDQSEPLNGGSNFVVMYHPKIQRQMKTAFRSALIDTGTTLRLNSLDQQISDYGFTLVKNPYLSTHASIYVFADDGLSFLRAEEYAPKIESIAEGSEYAIRNLAHEHFVRFSVGVAPYRWESALQYEMLAA